MTKNKHSPRKTAAVVRAAGHQIPQIAKAVENRPDSGQNEVQEAVKPSDRFVFALAPPESCRHGLSNSSRLRAGPAGDRPIDPRRRAGRSALGNGGGPAAAVPRRRAGRALHQSHRLLVSHAGQPVRHHGADAATSSATRWRRSAGWWRCRSIRPTCCGGRGCI